MAQLGVCRTCGKTVSDEAPTCPHCGQPSPYTSAPAPASRAMDLARQGKKIEAIKLVREEMGIDLKGAKDIVDSWGK